MFLLHSRTQGIRPKHHQTHLLAILLILIPTLHHVHAQLSQNSDAVESNSDEYNNDAYNQEILEDKSELRLPWRGKPSSIDTTNDPWSTNDTYHIVKDNGGKCDWCGNKKRMKGESKIVEVKKDDVYLMPGDCNEFISPKRPKKYPNNIDYRWRYKTSPCSVITLNIPKGSIQKSVGCHRDKLSVKVGGKTIQKCAEFFDFVVDSGDTGEMNIRFETNHRIRWWGYEGTICASECSTTTSTTTTTTTTTSTSTTTTTETPVACDDICGNVNGYTGPGTGENRISSISDAPNRYPWVVIVDVMREHVFVRCGGYLISKFHVITSAYCFYQENPIGLESVTVRVTAGEYDLTSGEKETGPASQVIYSTNVTEYPDYDYTIGTGVFNMAVITIPGNGFTLNSRVCPICMADPSMKVPSTLYVSAYGWTKHNFPAVNLTEISLSMCPFPIGDDLLCIYIQGNTPCHGDDGSAIYSLNTGDGKYYSYGHVNAIITSKCPVQGFVLPCVKLSYYQDWIDSITGPRYCNNN